MARAKEDSRGPPTRAPQARRPGSAPRAATRAAAGGAGGVGAAAVGVGYVHGVIPDGGTGYTYLIFRDGAVRDTDSFLRLLCV